jgi:uncharacterized lipoprotein YbaY
MDKGTGRAAREPAAVSVAPQEFEGIVQGGVIKLFRAALPDGTRVQVRVKK